MKQTIASATGGAYIMVMMYAIISVINLIILLVEIILKLVKKQKLLRENYVILAGQLAKLVSAVVWILMLVCSTNPAVSAASRLIMALCVFVCLASGILTGITVFTGEGLKALHRGCRLVYTLCCFFVSIMLADVLMFHFWT